MTNDKINAAVELVAKALDVSKDELGPESSMDNTPIWDSFEHMNVCLLFEQQFGIKLNMDAIATATSVRALADLIP